MEEIMLKLNKRIIVVDLKNKKKDHLMINSLNGLVDIIHQEEYSIFSVWQKGASMVPATKKEQDLYQKLVERKYIVDEDEEKEMEEAILDALKRQYIQNKELCSNAVFVLSYGCNFACQYCYEEKEHGTVKMTKEMVDKVFELHDNKLYSIGLFGGEPLLPANREIITYIVERAPKASYNIISNGYYVEEYMDILKKVTITNIQITLDGTEEYHDRSRVLKNGKGTYNKILRGIRLLLDSSIPVTIRMNVSVENIEECYKEIDLLRSYGWKGNLKFELQPLFQIDEQKREKLYNVFFEKESMENYKNDMLQRLSTISGFLYNGTRMYPVLKACDREVTGKYYDAEGYVYSCILAVGNTKKAIGRYYPTYEMKEKSFATRDITTIEKCKDCANAFLCGGGCPNGLPEDVDLYSPNCVSFMRELDFFVPCVYGLKFNC